MFEIEIERIKKKKLIFETNHWSTLDHNDWIWSIRIIWIWNSTFSHSHFLLNPNQKKKKTKLCLDSFDGRETLFVHVVSLSISIILSFSSFDLIFFWSSLVSLSHSWLIDKQFSDFISDFGRLFSLGSFDCVQVSKWVKWKNRCLIEQQSIEIEEIEKKKLEIKVRKKNHTIDIIENFFFHSSSSLWEYLSPSSLYQTHRHTHTFTPKHHLRSDKIHCNGLAISNDQDDDEWVRWSSNDWIWN